MVLANCQDCLPTLIHNATVCKPWDYDSTKIHNPTVCKPWDYGFQYCHYHFLGSDYDSTEIHNPTVCEQ